jgi:hypothetical protein
MQTDVVRCTSELDFKMSETKKVLVKRQCNGISYILGHYVIMKLLFIYFYICTLHLDNIKVYYSPTNAEVIVLKTTLKFTLK